MHGYGQFCPVAVACEVFAERWTPLILRELFAGSRRFSDIRRGMPLISRALLTQRLRHLEDVGVIESRPAGRGREYRLTQAGAEFHGVIEELGAWGQRWMPGRASAENLDAMLLLWNVRRRLAVDQLPEGRTVVRFDFRGVPGGGGRGAAGRRGRGGGRAGAGSPPASRRRAVRGAPSDGRALSTARAGEGEAGPSAGAGRG